jgi:hypothetical protein
MGRGSLVTSAVTAVYFCYVSDTGWLDEQAIYDHGGVYDVQ